MARRTLGSMLMSGVVLLLAALASFTASNGLPALAHEGPALTPASVTKDIIQGGSVVIDKTVHTPAIPPGLDVVFLADTTGSMTEELGAVQAGIGPIIAGVLVSSPTAAFGAAEYKDTGDGAAVYTLNAPVTADAGAAAAAGVATWAAGGGGDGPEAQLNALHLLATAAATAWRAPLSTHTRVVVWFGDADGHDPSLGATQASVISDLTTGPFSPIKANAIPITPISLGSVGLDGFPNESSATVGQATAITGATGGSIIAADAATIVAAIIAGLGSLPVTVSMTTDCLAPISVSFAPASLVVTSGTDAGFTETISVDATAAPGVYVCDDWALLNGEPMKDASGAIIKEHKTITVLDVTPPTASCTPTTNPAGQNEPTAPGKGGQGQNQDGYYILHGTDNVAVASIVVRDSGSSFVSNPFADGDKVKVTQAPGVTPSDNRPGPGVIVSHLRLKGDAILKVTDTSGNFTEVTCLVPPPPK